MEHTASGSPFISVRKDGSKDSLTIPASKKGPITKARKHETEAITTDSAA
jgi:hypothetical protein